MSEHTQDQPCAKIVSCTVDLGRTIDEGSNPWVGSVRALRNLEALAVIVDGVALRYDPLALHTQNIGKVRAGMDESGARFGRPHYKPVVIP